MSREKKIKRAVEALKLELLAGEAYPCPRCGRMTMNTERPMLNALSRYADVYICAKCGTDEAVRDMVGNPLPFVDWGKELIVRMMEDEELKKLIAKYQQRADAAEQAYQETGARRYYTTHWKNQNTANALRIALSAKDEHETLCNMRMLLSNFATRGAAATSSFHPSDEQVKLALELAREIAEYGRRNGLIREEGYDHDRKAH